MRAPRSAAFAAVAILLLLSTLIGGPPRPGTTANMRPAAAVAWPPSAGLLIAEVVTGGASASDEYVELTNAGPVPADLAGLELAYATSSGSTVTRKATWSEPTLLATGQHLLVANALGAYASTADATYAGGLAATGGALVLRPVGGSPVDAVGWGDATNAYVEGAAAAAPPAGQSIERRPGGGDGNVTDTNQNAADWNVLPAPIPQNRSAAPVPSSTPGPSPSPSASGTPSPSAEPSPTPTAPPSPSPAPSADPSATPTPTPEPSQDASPSPTATPSPSADPSGVPSPSPTATPEPTPTPTLTPAPSPTPVPTPTPSPTPEPTPTSTPTPEPTSTPIASVSIAAARAAADGTAVTLEGILSTPLGMLEGGRGGFLQDGTGGIAIYAAAPLEPIAAGSLLRLAGSIDDRYGQRTVRLDGPPTVLAGGPVPIPVEATTGGAAEPLEGLRIHVHGTIVDAATILSDGPAVTVDDGSGPLRVILAGSTSPNVPARGSHVSAAGSLGQRDSSGIGTSGYRLFVVDPADVVVEPSPSPSPSPDPTESPSASPTPVPSPSPSPSPTPSPAPSSTPSPTPSPSVTPAPSPTPTATPAPTPSPTPTGEPVAIRAARAAAIGATVHVRGGVTAESGHVGLPPLGVIADSTGGIFIRFPDGVAPARGALLDVTGRLADPYGQLEIRPTADGVHLVGTATPADPLPIAAASLGELVEARTVTLDATLDAAIVREPGGDLVLRLRDAGGTMFSARAARASGLVPDAALRGDRVRLTGVVGQRASARGKLDGYRVWLRDPSDLARTSGAAPGPTQAPGATPRPGGSDPPIVTIAAALRLGSGSATVEGTVTVPSTLLDATGRRSLVQDATAAVEVLLPRDTTAPRPGDRIRIVGTLGRAYGAPRITAATLVIVAHVAEPAPLAIRGPLSAAVEWRLVSLEGTVADQRRLGDRWRADVEVAGETVPVAGLPGAAIPASVLVEGSRVRVIGIVRRPSPSSTDQHFVVVPRSAADIRTLARAPSPAASEGTRLGPSGAGSPTGPEGFDPAGIESATGQVSADVAQLAGLAGRSVRVGGLVVAVDADGLLLDDGTGTARVALVGDARSLLPLLGPGDAIGAAGVVEAGTPPGVRVTDPAFLVRLGDLGEALPIEDEVLPPGTEPAPDAELSTSPPVSGPDSRGPARADPSGPVTAGAGSIGALATAGAMLAVVRRRRMQRALRTRIARRMAELGTAFAAAQAPGTRDARMDSAAPSTDTGQVVRESA